MQTLRAKYYNTGKVELLEMPTGDVKKEGADVLVFFPEGVAEGKLKGAPPDELFKLSGIMSLGGDAVEDTENFYD